MTVMWRDFEAFQRRVYIDGSKYPWPDVKPRLFVDHGLNEKFDSSLDLELSHWIPNQTPVEYQGDTSTEICLNFVRQNFGNRRALIVNNHVDLDGLASTYVLLEPRTGLEHENSLVQFAESGDFFRYHNPYIEAFTQQILGLCSDLFQKGEDPLKICFAALLEIDDILNGKKGVTQASHQMTLIERSFEKVDKGIIERNIHHNRLVSFLLPQLQDDHAVRSQLEVWTVNRPPLEHLALLPQARQRFDFEKFQLVILPDRGKGFFYDLYIPGYAWAKTETFWKIPGLHPSQTQKHVLELRHHGLNQAVAKLNQMEPASGAWYLAEQFNVFRTIPGRAFPVIASFLDSEHAAAASYLPPETVIAIFAEALQE